MAVSGLLAQYLAIRSQLDYAQQQQVRWNNMATAMSKKLSNQTSYEEKWESKSEEMYDSYGQSKKLDAKGTLFQNQDGGIGSDPSVRALRNDRAALAELYANTSVPKYDSELLEEYTDLDMEYTTMQNMYDTLCEELQAQADALKERLGTEAQDTHLLGS